ncbi:transposase [Streptomyces sp. NBC_01242]|uniref:transposase n=1 Tax=unclassified Streptomyces TaxID=2593676 RepID=UPI00339066AE
MGSKYTKRYSEEYKRDAVELVCSSGRTVTDVAWQLDVSAESLRAWVKKAKAAEVTETGGKGLYSERWDSVDCFYRRPAVSRPSKVMSKAWSAAFQRMVQRLLPVPLGSRLITAR